MSGFWMAFTHSLCVCLCVCVCVRAMCRCALLSFHLCVLKLAKVLVGGCKSLSSSRMRWVFGERLESLLTGSQIDEVMVMDGGNKGLDVLSVVSDEAGMNHPSGAAEHDAALYQSFLPRCPTLSQSFPPSCHFLIIMRFLHEQNKA